MTSHAYRLDVTTPPSRKDQMTLKKSLYGPYTVLGFYRRWYMAPI